MYLLVASGRGHQCPLCMIVVHRRRCALWSRLGGAFCPWRWPSHCGSTSLSMVVAVVACCRGLCFMFIPRGCGLLSSMKDDNICVRVRSGEERAFTYPGLSFCNAKEAIPPIHHPRCCRALHLVFEAAESDPASMNRRCRCPVSFASSLSGDVVPRHRRPVLVLCHSDDDEQPIGRLVATSLWTTWHLGCV